MTCVDDPHGIPHESTCTARAHTHSLTHSLTSLAYLQLWDNPHMPETQWYIRDAGGGNFSIANAKSKKCVNIYGAGRNNGPSVHIYAVLCFATEELLQHRRMLWQSHPCICGPDPQMSVCLHLFILRRERHPVGQPRQTRNTIQASFPRWGYARHNSPPHMYRRGMSSVFIFVLI